MSNLISGLIAVSMACVFLIFYAVRLKSVVLWIIIAGNLACLLYDYVRSLRNGNNQTDV